MADVPRKHKAQLTFARKLLRLRQRRDRLLLQQRVMAVALQQVEERMIELEEEANVDA